MGRENDAMLEFLRDDRRFADLFNGGLFGGASVVDPADLEEAGETYTEYRGEDGKANDKANDKEDRTGPKKKTITTPRTRDIKKRLRSGTELRILAVEEQSLVDYTMPWRCMNYDVLEYGRQVRNRRRENRKAGNYAGEGERLCRFRKTDRLTPVYTICLYHGAEPWDGPRTLREMMDFGSDRERELWEKKFSDYQMQLICVNELEDISAFTTELRELFGIMNYRNDKQGMNTFLAKHEEYKNLDEETARTIGAVMGVRNFMENDERFKSEGGYDMCQAIREMWEDGVNEGINRGLSEGLNRGLREGRCEALLTSARAVMEKIHCTAGEALAFLNVPEAEWENYLSRISEES